MSGPSLETRLSAMEAEVKTLKKQVKAKEEAHQ